MCLRGAIQEEWCHDGQNQERGPRVAADDGSAGAAWALPPGPLRAAPGSVTGALRVSDTPEKTRPHLTLSLVGSGYSRVIPIRISNVPDAHIERCLKEAAETLINEYMLGLEAAKKGA